MHCFQAQEYKLFLAQKEMSINPDRAVKKKKKQLACIHNIDTMTPATTHIHNDFDCKAVF